MFWVVGYGVPEMFWAVDAFGCKVEEDCKKVSDDFSLGMYGRLSCSQNILVLSTDKFKCPELRDYLH